MCIADIATILDNIVSDAPSFAVGNGDSSYMKRNSPSEFSPFPGFFNSPEIDLAVASIHPSGTISFPYMSLN